MNQCPNYDNETKLTDLTVGEFKNMLEDFLRARELKQFKQEQMFELDKIMTRLSKPTKLYVI